MPVLTTVAIRWVDGNTGKKYEARFAMDDVMAQDSRMARHVLKRLSDKVIEAVYG